MPQQRRGLLAHRCEHEGTSPPDCAARSDAAGILPPSLHLAATPGALAVARNFEAGIYLQDLLVAAVVAILLTRLVLGVSGFPRLGGGGLHVAYMLWGGLLMLVGLVLLLAVIGKPAKRLAALIGGAGFGLFIDELGEFITADNN
jgi:hypothetical protein